MPRSPVLAAHDLYAALNRGDRDAALALLAEDVEILASDVRGEVSLTHGHDAVRRWWAELEAARGRVRLYVSEAREIDARAVCAVAVATQLPRGTLDVAATVWTVVGLDEGGLIASSWSYATEGEALAAAREGTAFPAVRRRGDA